MPTPGQPETAAKPLTVDERLAQAREKKNKRLVSQEDTRKAEELAILELENKLEEDGKGPRGVNFEIVDGGSEGPIALRLGELVLFKRFQATMKGDREPTQEEFHQFVFPNVLHPEPSAFNALAFKRPIIVRRCANALAVLYGARDDEARGKY